jgi:exopolyphosphatase/guanosine-5'-triphosphate,3'-diphosphate pyrophosphatase
MVGGMQVHNVRRIAVIDVGSNSVKLLVAESSDNAVIPIYEATHISRLGEGIWTNGLISPQAVRRNVEAIQECLKSAHNYHAATIIAVGTMALRTASNSGEFIDRVRDSTGVAIEIISGDEEARLAYMAVLSGLPVQEEELAVFDIGGGSTEFVFGRGSTVDKRFSVGLGAIRITEEFIKSDPVTKNQLKAALGAIDQVLAEHSVTGNVPRLVGIGGTITAVGAVQYKMKEYDPSLVQGATLTLREVEKQIRMYSKRTIEERLQIIGLQPKRADIILAGSLILKVIMERLGADSLIMSHRGLRHGLAYDHFRKAAT